METVLQAGIISAPLQVLIDRLETFVVGETSLILGADDEAQKLRRTLERIRALVAHVQENRLVSPNSVSNEAWKVWLKDVEELLYSADNVLDEISLNLAKSKANLAADNQVRNVLVSTLKWNVPGEMKETRQQLEDIYKEMHTLFMIELTKFGSYKVLNSRLQHSKSCTSSLVDEGSWVGRNREKDEVLKMLWDEGPNTKNVSVIPLVGMGGIGKTTLTRMVYNNCNVVTRFEVRMWASVSMDFDAIRITKSILESLLGKRCKLLDLDPIQVKLRDLIGGKRFLLVLDNYWSEEYIEWDVLSSPFKVGARGSKIIVTTRSTRVSQILGTAPSYYLESLSDENCWELMKQRAFSNNNMENNLQMEEIGRLIAMKCKGVPIAAVTLGSVLQFKDSLAEWRSVLESEIWDLPQEQSGVFQALNLSYHHLPAHLKTCFLYCAIFPKNHDFTVNELVLLWMAQGFIRHSGKMLPEDLGNIYFNDLLRRSFFQLSHATTQGEKSYKMHDLIHGMAQSISGNTCLHQKVNQRTEGYTIFRNTRHISFHYESTQSMTLEGCDRYKNLRTFRVTSENGSNIQVSYGLFPEMKFLRELNLSWMGLDDVPNSIGSLKCLRYLNLSGNHFMMLPESITNLFGLLILKLEECVRLFELPRGMKNMVNLRHLLLNVKQLNCMPSEFGKLVNLVSLPAFLVGKGCAIKELKNMRSLRGSICIKNLEHVLNVNEAREAMLHMKPFLETLELEWNESTSVYHSAEVLAGLQPHENLKELLLTNYNGFQLPEWFTNPRYRCRISSIHLQSCQHYRIISPLAKLLQLKSLVIEDMPGLSHIDAWFSGFPSLESLKLKSIPNLTSWGALYNFPCLQTLDIIDCPRLTNLPELHAISLHCLNIAGCNSLLSLPRYGLPNSLQKLTISDCNIIKDRCRVEEGEDWPKIRSIPTIEIDYVEITWDMRRL